jgi:hypothetical protein
VHQRLAKRAACHFPTSVRIHTRCAGSAAIRAAARTAESWVGFRLLWTSTFLTRATASSQPAVTVSSTLLERQKTLIRTGLRCACSLVAHLVLHALDGHGMHWIGMHALDWHGMHWIGTACTGLMHAVCMALQLCSCASACWVWIYCEGNAAPVATLTLPESLHMLDSVCAGVS